MAIFCFWKELHEFSCTGLTFLNVPFKVAKEYKTSYNSKSKQAWGYLITWSHRCCSLKDCADCHFCQQQQFVRSRRKRAKAATWVKDNCATINGLVRLEVLTLLVYTKQSWCTIAVKRLNWEPDSKSPDCLRPPKELLAEARFNLSLHSSLPIWG